MQAGLLRVSELDRPEQYAELLPQTHNWTLYHTTTWLDFLDRVCPGERMLLGVWRGDEMVAVWPTRKVRKGPLRILGSPFPGWNTPYMAPAMLVDGIPSSEFLPAYAAFLKTAGIHHAEVVSFDTDLAPAPGWAIERQQTYTAEIGADPEAVLSSLSKSCRKHIRRGLKDGVTTEFIDDPKFVDIYYDQLEQVFAKHDRSPTYTRQRVRALWETLHPAGILKASWATFDGQIVATRMDMVGNGMLHSFGSASEQADTLKHNPNECLRYHVMAWASENGLHRYDMSGGGDYKRKFNGEHVYFTRYIRSSWLLRKARDLARKWVYWRGKFRGRKRADRPQENAGESPHA